MCSEYPDYPVVLRQFAFYLQLEKCDDKLYKYARKSTENKDEYCTAISINHGTWHEILFVTVLGWAIACDHIYVLRQNIHRNVRERKHRIKVAEQKGRFKFGRIWILP